MVVVVVVVFDDKDDIVGDSRLRISSRPKLYSSLTHKHTHMKADRTTYKTWQEEGTHD